MKVFLSCVSTEFKTYRLKLANQLGALKDRPCEVKVQEDFQQGGYTLLDKLADYVRECDLVIHLAGDACGARPTDKQVRALFQTLGEEHLDPRPERSYTQWEYHLAIRFGRRMFVYLASADAPRDSSLPVHQTDEEAALQRSHLDAIRRSGKHYGGFTSYNTLVREVFHDLGLEPELKINNLPYKSLGSLFKGREKFLRRIHETLGRVEHRGHQRFAAITASATAAAVHGLGGIGKSRTAIEYAHRYAEEYTALLFVRADSPAGLQQNLAALSGPTVLDLPEKAAKETGVQLASVLQWLKQHPAWLLIFDNVDTEEAAQAVQELMGSLTPAGQVLVTSRLSNWPAAVESLTLDVLEGRDAAAFLLERTQNRRRKTLDDDPQANAVAAELGHLALALEQAGAYIERNRLTFAEYLAEWEKRRDKVLAWFDERLMQYPMSVAVTWQTSFDSLSEPARRLLQTLAWLAPDPMPEWLIETGGGSSVLGVRRKTSPGTKRRRALKTADSTGSVADVREALAELESHSLVKRADETASFTVHRLVQDVTRRGDGRHTYLKAALRWVNDSFVGPPDDVRAWPVLTRLAPHTLTVTRYADEDQISEPTAKLMNELGLLYYKQAQFTAAEPLLRRAQAIDEHAHGPDHPNVARDLNNLAQLLKATNRLGEAEPLMRRVVEIYQKARGPGHPDVATGLFNLASLLEDTNRVGEAEPMYRLALLIGLNAYGPDHPEVAKFLNNLALLLSNTNRLSEAEPLMRGVVEIFKKAYGPDHPYVATGLNNLARLLQATNRPEEAESMFRLALAIRLHAYGPDHPEIAELLNNLGLLLHETNRLEEAEQVLRRALVIDQEAYGPNHLDVAFDLYNLAELLQATHRVDEAVPLMRRSVEILAKFTRDTGHEHPQLRQATINYSRLLLEQGGLPHN